MPLINIKRLKYRAEAIARTYTTPGAIALALSVTGGSLWAIHEAIPADKNDFPEAYLRVAEQIGLLPETIRSVLAWGYLMFLICAGCMWILHIAFLTPKLFQAGGVGHRFCARLITDVREAVELQGEIVRLFFPRSPVPRYAAAAQSKNNKRLVGLYDGITLVGYCALWPVTPEIGGHIQNGAMTDDELTPEHLLPTLDTCKAEHVIILGIGILPEIRHDDSGAFWTLFVRVKKVLREHYYCGQSQRPIVFTAVAYTEEGIRLCELMGFHRLGHSVQYECDERHFGWLKALGGMLGLYSPRRHPVYTRKMTCEELGFVDPM